MVAVSFGSQPQSVAASLNSLPEFHGVLLPAALFLLRHLTTHAAIYSLAWSFAYDLMPSFAYDLMPLWMRNFTLPEKSCFATLNDVSVTY